MDLIRTLEQEEIARLEQDGAGFRAGRHRHRQRQRRRRHPQARAGLRRRRHRQAQPRAELQLHRAQDLERRRRGAHVPALQPADRVDRGQAPRRRAPRQAVLPARPLAASRRASRKSWPDDVGLRCRPQRRAAARSEFPAQPKAGLARLHVVVLKPRLSIPQDVPVVGVDDHLPALDVPAMQAQALRARFATPPVGSRSSISSGASASAQPAHASVLVPLWSWATS